MSDYTLVLVDTTGIQSYIFGSNRLRENVGASHLVYMATEGWLREDPDRLLGTTKHNLSKSPHSNPHDTQNNDEQLRIIDDNLDAELLYAGGGNTVLLFRNEGEETLAKKFTHNLSRKLIEEAPRLEVAAVRQPVDLQQGSLALAFKEGFRKLKKKKAERERSQELLGLGVTAACQSTGLVASYEQEEPGSGDSNDINETEQAASENNNPLSKFLISSSVKAKWLNNPPANQRLNHQLGNLLGKHYRFPLDFDHLGRSKGDFSYIAVVHADGNGMGRTLQEIIEQYEVRTGIDANNALIRQIRTFSHAVNAAGLNALSMVVEEVVEWSERQLRKGDAPSAAQSKGRLNLAIRPIVFGGDDVTFVCDGRIGLKAAQVFLRAFGEQEIPDAAGKMRPGCAAAGVAIVKTHYPFARAYMLSEELCKNAKSEFEREAPALDWHLAQSGLFGDLSEIRQREYQEQVDDGKVTSSLLMRPIVTNNYDVAGWRTWDKFVALLNSFQQETDDKKAEWPRNKVMELRDAIRGNSVDTFTDGYKKLPQIDANETQHITNGSLSGRSGYFDAIEMIEQEVW